VHFDVSRPPNMITLFFMFRWAWYGFNKKHTGTRYVELMILHPVGSAGHIAHSGTFEARNVKTTFFMLRCARCGFHKKCAETHYTKLTFYINWDLWVT
jgi:hypothetical protein